MVPLTHRNLLANLEGLHGVLDFGPADVILANLPYFHVFGINTGLWLPLVTGATVVTVPSPLEYRAICTAIREERMTMVIGTPVFLAGYLQKSEPGDFESVRLLITGADKCPESLRNGFWERHHARPARGLRHDRDKPGHRRQLAVAQPAGQRRPRAAQPRGPPGALGHGRASARSAPSARSS